MTELFKRKRIVHGTPAGYQAHRRRGQRACPPCAEAMTAYSTAVDIRVGRNAYVRVPVELLGVLAANAGPEVREVVDVMLRAVVVGACEERARRDPDFAEHFPSPASSPYAGPEPRVWPTTVTTEPAHVDAVRDDEGDTWERDADGLWHSDSAASGWRWAALMHEFGPLAEVQHTTLESGR